MLERKDRLNLIARAYSMGPVIRYDDRHFGGRCVFGSLEFTAATLGFWQPRKTTLQSFPSYDRCRAFMALLSDASARERYSTAESIARRNDAGKFELAWTRIVKASGLTWDEVRDEIERIRGNAVSSSVAIAVNAAAAPSDRPAPADVVESLLASLSGVQAEACVSA